MTAMNAELVEEYMRPILEAAWTGEFEKIKNMQLVWEPSVAASRPPGVAKEHCILGGRVSSWEPDCSATRR